MKIGPTIALLWSAELIKPQDYKHRAPPERFPAKSPPTYKS
jgi:hypothetical protein